MDFLGRNILNLHGHFGENLNSMIVHSNSRLKVSLLEELTMTKSKGYIVNESFDDLLGFAFEIFNIFFVLGKIELKICASLSTFHLFS